MEHRWSFRKAMTGSVIVECPRLGMVRASLRDMSLGGMFVETGSTNLPMNAPVAVSISPLVPNGQNAGTSLQAMVVRHTTEGAGLMFLDPKVDTLRVLREVLGEEVSPPRQRRPVPRGR
jgi:hypothetical protein